MFQGIGQIVCVRKSYGVELEGLSALRDFEESGMAKAAQPC